MVEMVKTGSGRVWELDLKGLIKSIAAKVSHGGDKLIFIKEFPVRRFYNFMRISKFWN